MRLRMRRAVVTVLVGCSLLVMFFLSGSKWSSCTDVNRLDNNFYRDGTPRPDGSKLMRLASRVVDLSKNSIPYQELDCVINGEYTVGCRREGEDVYLPFSFISKYFEVYGKLTQNGEDERFDWSHSYSHVYVPDGTYSPTGIFMSFEHYNVEKRERVKCISAIEGVPISTQWGAQGYFYPIQIAQYGLSHFSKFLTEKPRSSIVIEDAEDDSAADRWAVVGQRGTVGSVIDLHRNTHVIEFDTSDSIHNPGILHQLENIAFGFLFFDVRFANNGSVTVAMEMKGRPNHLFYLHYICSENVLAVSEDNVYYGIGLRRTWGRVTRDLIVDVQKGIMMQLGKKYRGSRLVPLRIISVSVRGHGWIDNITFASSAHLEQMYDAADWFVRHQDNKGGWPIMVTRKLALGRLELPPGWYSAMAQGQAISLLIRAYDRTKIRAYLDCALRATKLYSIPSGEGGVRAMFADKYPWYEEYPTVPSSFVLNGFIYSLIGLYDLKTVAPPEEAQDIESLYSTGISSLKTLLPLFDTGSGSVYDLRHFTLGISPNLARWDYHTTHINQLLLLSTIEDDPVFEAVANRWIGYMKGKRAAHN